MAMRKVQLYLTEDQYRFVKQRAGTSGSIAAVVRELIDEAGRPRDYSNDPFFRHVTDSKEGSGRSYSAELAKRQLHRRGH